MTEPGSFITQREYTYDILGRPTARHTARQSRVVSDTFAHNSRSELVDAQVNGKDYEYAYDNIGNREFALEDGKASMYESNALNQYTSISENGAAAFVPMFDADGNQTLIKTETGIWSTVYNAENRPVSFTNSESNTVVECAYDSMGRRAYKKVTVNGSVTLHQRYIYRGYLQIAALDLTRTAHPALWYITWDPSQPVATRPLAIQINGTWYTYGIDLTKNICELYSPSGAISTSYTYTPFGQVIASGSVTQSPRGLGGGLDKPRSEFAPQGRAGNGVSASQPIQWSSELWDAELGLVYYNWRYYNAWCGRWNARDKLPKQQESDLYVFNRNSPELKIDVLGKITMIIHGTRLFHYRFLYTFGKEEEKWWDLNYSNDSFAVKLNESVGDVWKTTSGKQFNYNYNQPFTWNGLNRHRSRWSAGEVLAKMIIQIRTCFPNERINLVAHSHGGNVVMSALDILSQENDKKNYMVNYVVLLGTPHVSIQHNNVKRALYFTNAGRNMIKNAIYSISSESDIVQDNLADLKDGISRNNLPKDYETDFFDFVQVEKFYNLKDTSNRTTLTHYTPGKDEDWFTKDGSYGHDDLHNVTFAKMVGELLTGIKPKNVKSIPLRKAGN